MTLSASRVMAQGKTSFPYEQDAIEFVKQMLPDSEPYRMWALVDMVEPSGRRYELDLLVLGRHALYLIEIKSHPGTVEGGANDWKFTFPDAGESSRENPIRLTALKARVLGGLIERKLPNRRRPWVEPLVFLSDPKIQVRLDEGGRMGVVTRSDLVRALTHADFPGARPSLRDHVIDKPLAQDTVRVLRELGIAQSKGALKIGELVLGEVLEDGPGYQDREARNEQMPGLGSRVRTYLVPQSPTQERRAQLLRAAGREASLLTALSDHRFILHVNNYVPDGPTGGPCILFEPFQGSVPLDVFLRRNQDLSFDRRIRILEQVGEALEYCHRKKILHRGLHPGAVLVRDKETSHEKDREIETRLHNFQLAMHEGGSLGTSHISALGTDPAVLYRAPEVIADPSCASAASDVFSLGALAYFVLTGLPPGTDPAERQRLLDSGGGKLSVAAVRDDLAGKAEEDALTIEEVVGYATEENPNERADSAIVWVGLLLDAATAPLLKAQGKLDPLEARPGDMLGTDLEVRALLGSGATSRVLRVLRGDSLCALKVSLSAEMDDRLRAEAAALEKLRSERIVALLDRLKLGERTCLLLTDAGETLADLLGKKGPLSLDYAHRFGDDLLQAVQTLEESGVQHRDIKPANLGVLSGASKKTRHLLLFDFSLSGLDPRAITAGTPAYRDPSLHKRGFWDEAADRYAAAVTLYEMLTGTRPRRSQDEEASREEVVLDAERFDASVRDRLLAFFRKALGRDAASRQQSAEAMRDEWKACFVTPLNAAVDADEERGPLSDAELAALAEETPIEALPLSARAKNALDRSGMIAVRDLLRLPLNQLSSIRGVGRDTARDILEFVRRYQAARPEASVPEALPFQSGYRGTESGVAFVAGLSSDAAGALEDAGLGLLSQVAAAPRSRVERILGRYPGSLAAVRAALSQMTVGSGDVSGEAPGTIEAWVQALCPQQQGRGQAHWKQVRLLLGLDEVDGESLPDAAPLAQRLGVTRQALYASLGKARDAWCKNPALSSLHEQVGAALESLGGAAPLIRVAEVLPGFLPHEAGGAPVDSKEALRQAAALVRIAGETSDRLAMSRIHERPWVGVTREHMEVARAMGDQADELARREPLPSSEEVRDVLQKMVEKLGGAMAIFSALAPERLVALAAEASKGAGRSARLELYPRGMVAVRALVLSAGALAGTEIKPEDVVRVVSARYPEAEPLPQRPALDVLMDRLQLSYDQERRAYLRRGASLLTASSTVIAPRRRPTLPTGHRPPQNPEAQEAREFDEHIRLAAQRGDFRVLDVSSAYAEVAARELADRLGIEARSLDRELIAAAEEKMKADQVDPEAVYEADRVGPTGEGWPLLCHLMKESAEALATRLLSSGPRVLLTDPGLLGRYQLGDFLRTLVEATQKDGGPAIFLVLPQQDNSGLAPIDAVTGPLPIPTTSQAQRLKVPGTWLANLHRGA